ncbi:hypothetical protein AB0N16_01995 [Streptomyces sp. NPDC051105]|uniref:hypothetical protein n=1 Tax=Streptomyces sp. NPDC051105 TaxID=3154843 RepID=UPI00344A02A1
MPSPPVPARAPPGAPRRPRAALRRLGHPLLGAPGLAPAAAPTGPVYAVLAALPAAGFTLCALARDDLPATASRLVRRVELVCGGTPAGVAAYLTAGLPREAHGTGGT